MKDGGFSNELEMTGGDNKDEESSFGSIPPYNSYSDSSDEEDGIAEILDYKKMKRSGQERLKVKFTNGDTTWSNIENVRIDEPNMVKAFMEKLEETEKEKAVEAASPFHCDVDHNKYSPGVTCVPEHSATYSKPGENLDSCCVDCSIKFSHKGRQGKTGDGATLQFKCGPSHPIYRCINYTKGCTWHACDNCLKIGVELVEHERRMKWEQQFEAAGSDSNNCSEENNESDCSDDDSSDESQ